MAAAWDHIRQNNKWAVLVLAGLVLAIRSRLFLASVFIVIVGFVMYEINDKAPARTFTPMPSFTQEEYNEAAKRMAEESRQLEKQEPATQ